MDKVTVVGSGHVGASTAELLAARELADVVLLDIVEGVPQGKALDLQQSGPILGFDRSVRGTNNYVDTQGSDVVVVTAGFPRKPGMSRSDLLNKNAAIVRDVVTEAARYSPDAILLVVTNPLDAMTQLAYGVSKFPKRRVVGMAGVLDTARFRTLIAQELDVSVDNTHAFVLGGHGDQMVPLARYSTVAGVPITELLSAEAVARLVERTRGGGAEIVGLLKSGSAYFAPAAAVVDMVEAILRDKKKILPCSSYLEGEYGVDGLFMGVPTKLGRNGVEQILEIALTDDERSQLAQSADAVRELVDMLNL